MPELGLGARAQQERERRATESVSVVERRMRRATVVAEFVLNVVDALLEVGLILGVLFAGARG